MSNPRAPALHLDRASLAVLAHPLRARLLAELRLSGPATATTLAAVLHTNSGATSYHLRKLAQAALVVDSGEGKGRRRLWNANAAFRPHDQDSGDDAEADAALTWLARDYIHHFTDRAEDWLESQDQLARRLARARRPVGPSGPGHRRTAGSAAPGSGGGP